ncbi:MAG: hypothetical protein IJ636_03940 [Bacteroidales bacterium]|nr:hypothetical protein [Bacteroidales bacterium]
MKGKSFLTVVLLVAGFLAAGVPSFAQDVITKKDGTDIQAKILEVNEDDIKYKRFDYLDGPVFTMLKSDILIIRYANGTNDVFDAKGKSVAATKSQVKEIVEDQEEEEVKKEVKKETKSRKETKKETKKESKKDKDKKDLKKDKKSSDDEKQEAVEEEEEVKKETKSRKETKKDTKKETKGSKAVDGIEVLSGDTFVLRESKAAQLVIDYSKTVVEGKPLSDYLRGQGSDWVEEWPENQEFVCEKFKEYFNGKSKSMTLVGEDDAAPCRMIIHVDEMDFGSVAGNPFNPYSGGAQISGRVEIVSNGKTSLTVAFYDIQGVRQMSSTWRLQFAFIELAKKLLKYAK